jgi:hypothetical protein
LGLGLACLALSHGATAQPVGALNVPTPEPAAAIRLNPVVADFADNRFCAPFDARLTLPQLKSLSESVLRVLDGLEAPVRSQLAFVRGLLPAELRPAVNPVIPLCFSLAPTTGYWGRTALLPEAADRLSVDYDIWIVGLRVALKTDLVPLPLPVTQNEIARAVTRYAWRLSLPGDSHSRLKVDEVGRPPPPGAVGTFDDRTRWHRGVEAGVTAFILDAQAAIDGRPLEPVATLDLEPLIAKLNAALSTGMVLSDTDEDLVARGIRAGLTAAAQARGKTSNPEETRAVATAVMNSASAMYWGHNLRHAVINTFAALTWGRSHTLAEERAQDRAALCEGLKPLWGDLTGCR